MSKWNQIKSAVKQENAIKEINKSTPTVALKSKDTVAIVVVNTASDDLNLTPKRILKLKDKCGIAFTGSIYDGMKIMKSLKNQFLERSMCSDNGEPISRIVNDLSLKMQAPTQYREGLVYSTGLIFASTENDEPTIYQIMPGGDVFKKKALCLGQNFKRAEAYLTDNLHKFSELDENELVVHGIKALLLTMKHTTYTRYNKINVMAGVVSTHTPFHVIMGSETDDLVDIALKTTNF